MISGVEISHTSSSGGLPLQQTSAALSGSAGQLPRMSFFLQPIRRLQKPPFPHRVKVFGAALQHTMKSGRSSPHFPIRSLGLQLILRAHLKPVPHLGSVMSQHVSRFPLHLLEEPERARLQNFFSVQEPGIFTPSLLKLHLRACARLTRERRRKPKIVPENMFMMHGGLDLCLILFSESVVWMCAWCLLLMTRFLSTRCSFYSLEIDWLWSIVYPVLQSRMTYRMRVRHE